MRSTVLSDYNNDWYQPGKNSIIRAFWYLINAIIFLNPLVPFSGIKIWMLRLFGASIGSSVVIKPSVNIKYPWRLKIGENSWIGEKVWIDNLDWVTIGSNCCISQGALLLCGNHNYKTVTFDLQIGPIIIEDGVWIGANSIVTGNVMCGSHAVLSLASVATKNLLPYTIYRGNPCIEIKKREILV